MDRFSDEGKKKVAAGVALTGLAAVVYMLYKKMGSQQNEDSAVTEEKVVIEEEQGGCCKGCGVEDKQEVKQESAGSYEAQLALEVQKFKKTLVAGESVMDLECLKQIMASSARLSEQDFKVLTKENREVRRALKSIDMGAYISKLNEYTEET